MPNENAPVVWDDETKKHRPLGQGEKMGGLDASSILSSDAGNLLGSGSDGLLYAGAAGMVSGEDGNLIGVDGYGKLVSSPDDVAEKLAAWFGSPSGDASGLAAALAPSLADGTTVTASDGRLSASDVLVEADGSDVPRLLSLRCADVVNVKDFGAAGDGVADDREAIRAAAARCAELGRAILFFPQGTYYMSGGCGLPGNVFVEAGGATFVRPPAGSTGFFSNAYGISDVPGEGVNGYEGNGNIYWHGGVFRGNGQSGNSRPFQFFSFGHARNIVVDGAVMYNHCGPSHAIELAGVENVAIRGCSFIGYNPVNVNPETGETETAVTREAIQLECLTSAGYWMANYDYTPTRFVTIDSCFFGPNDDAGLRACSVAVGGHAGSRPSSGEIQVHDVSITNCTFHKVYYACARLTAFSNVQFAGNRCYDCNRMVAFSGILAENVNAQSGQTQTRGLACANVVISGNLFYDRTDVAVDSWMAVATTNSFSGEANPVYHENIVISGNTFLRPGTALSSTRDYCIKLEGCRQLSISGNSFRYHTNNVIEIFGLSQAVSVTGNDLRHFDSYGISVWGSSGIEGVYIENNNVIGNWISGEYMAQGIRVQSVSDFRIVGNNVKTYITKPGGTQVAALMVDSGSSSGFVSGNTVTTENTDSDVYDITVTSSSAGVVCGENLVKTTTGGGSYRASTGTVPYTPTHGAYQVLRATNAHYSTLYRNLGLSSAPALAGAWSSTVGGVLTFGLAGNSEHSTLLALSDAADGETPSLCPVSDGAVRLGTGHRPYDAVYANSGDINISDARFKTDVADAGQEALLRAIGRVGLKLFRYSSAVAKKGDAARVHAGAVAQDVAAAFQAEGLDASRYGLFCHDSWEEKWEEHDVAGPDGSVVQERVKVQDAGERYALRYGELLVLECAYLRDRLDKAEARLAALEVGRS